MGADLASTFSMAFLPVAKLLLTCAFGAWLGSKSMQILTAESRKHMNMMVFLAYTPALVFCKLTYAVSLENLLAWWYMPVNVILCYTIGSGLAFIVISVTEPPPHLKPLIIACCAAGNIGNVPLVLVPSICLEKDNPFGTMETCSKNAVAYVSFGMWMGMVLTWTFIYNLLRPVDQKPSGNAVPSAGSSSVGSPHSSDFGEFQAGLHHNEFQDIGFSNQVMANNWNASASNFAKPQSPPLVLPEVVAPDLRSDPKGYFMSIAQKYDLKRIFTPPTAAALAGLTVGLIPPLKALMLGPLRAITDSADIIGQAMIPVMNLVLGASLVQGASTSELPMKTIMGIIIVRLCALPVIGMMMIKIAHDFGFLPEDPLFRFVLMVQYTMPTAMNVGTVAQLHGVGEKEVALILFWSYVTASVFITIWVLVYLEYTFS
ncbi:auxin efflux carrier family protein [Marchantia polymorpha subsp. ruderalis]|uniref:Uncharacterized protein n=1 Tax=Marchantia polymorpha TaxID=3197 RepID=A0A2R6WVJ3_MARPO|nr:hypothetical protein MARPO_0055s0125 [Marchantia polymorpha]PTQ37878.1 hypothetical protein MARPO_0055s0125 [Marchantia polymorpha]BBN02914.1 hypothetical protein Mp_2g19270 [Marchantia polymorpha subsp. ruderalis]BBN02915.1 hypothetical protein Mp_2g19270 [Marchantia polymorpha subsp. ruderalis]|eukprot:PTQ37877.1 hypothetical protein MARPO_0055s0125 [Marchantia polymorpha]